MGLPQQNEWRTVSLSCCFEKWINYDRWTDELVVFQGQMLIALLLYYLTVVKL